MIKSFESFIKFASLGSNGLDVSKIDFIKKMKNIENWIKHPVIRKIDQEIFLSDFGKNFVPYAKKLLAFLNEGVEVSKEYNVYDADNHLTIGISRDSASTWAINCIKNFNRLHPGLRLAILSDDKLSNDMIDLSSIIFWCTDRSIHSFDKEWYIEYQYGLYASSDYIKRNGKPTINNIGSHQIIAYSGNDNNTQITNWHINGEYGLPKLKPTILSQSRDFIVKLAANGLGLAAISDRQDVYYGYKHLERVLTDVNGPTLKSYFMVRRGQNEQVMCNISLLSNLFKKYFIDNEINVLDVQQ